MNIEKLKFIDDSSIQKIGECLDRRIENIDVLRNELKEWNDAYDKDPSPINWQFTTADARIKLRRLYPDINKFREERDNRRAAKQSTS